MAPFARVRPGRRLLAKTPQDPLKAEAGVSCRRLPAELRTRRHGAPIQAGHIA
jgi:hypothetical protein